jgi:hypothetical protein
MVLGHALMQRHQWVARFGGQPPPRSALMLTKLA